MVFVFKIRHFEEPLGLGKTEDRLVPYKFNIDWTDIVMLFKVSYWDMSVVKLLSHF